MINQFLSFYFYEGTIMIKAKHESMSDYGKVAVELTLSKPLDPMVANKVVASPEFNKKLSHGLFNYCKQNGEKFGPDELHQQGDIIHINHPGFEEQMSVYQISEVILNEDHKKMVMTSIKTAPKAPFSSIAITAEYILVQGEAKLTLSLLGNANSGSVLGMAKTLLAHMSNRVQRLATDPENTLRELDLISSLDVVKTLESPDFGNVPQGKKVKLVVPCSLEDVKAAINKPDFLKKIFPDVSGVSCEDDKAISINDQFTVKMSTVSYRMELIEEDIIFRVKAVGNKLQFLSDEGVAHFHRLGYEIELNELGKDKTSIDVGIYHSKSNVVAFASTLLTGLSYFTKKSPNINSVLEFRSRNFLSATIRLFDVYIREALQATLFVPQLGPDSNNKLSM
jgi:hypothetical protein